MTRPPTRPAQPASPDPPRLVRPGSACNRRAGRSGRPRPPRACAESPALRGLAGEGVRVVVVDSGVNPANPHVAAVAGGAGIDASGHASPGHVDRIGHGTAVFAAIQEKAPRAALYAVRVFRAELASTARALVAALDWAAAHEASLVNLSLGTANPRHAGMLADAVGRLAEAGGVVVSAAEARGGPMWPGALPGVVGVVPASGCPRSCVEVHAAAAGPALAASPCPRPVEGVPVERNLGGASFAVANATGLAARALQGHEGRLTKAGVLAGLEAAAG